MANRNNKVAKVYYVIGTTIYGAPIYCVHYI